ncbi:probable lipid-A-disaccharide synthase, mitochondrial isoform X5 [Beta vulgaris subsp. vulgaris]|uniref:probable lipid-A-disaccharide synthase, mitochondrial isoform X5 n=1 Tax=Beta vulgaris subsp. vulgaris TaxID=3555 RepID=UPI002037015B|nr:probable lipid-A-disaccharide synthase, mitochondrial isoform X5 [Beta vulgaris subsp. vulgaris]
MSVILRKAIHSLSREVIRNTGIIRRFSSISSRAVVDLAAKDGELRVFVVAGEVSGDTIGARLMASLKRISPFPVKFCGVGGSMMALHGLQSLFPMEDLAVMGIWELLPHLYKIRARLKESLEAASLFKPHVILTVDAKGFSFRFLKELRASYNLQLLDRPMHFHYVAPSFWAWRGGEARLKGLSHFVDHIFCLLPFEEEVCRLNGLAATFVGHPVLEDCLQLNLIAMGVLLFGSCILKLLSCKRETLLLGRFTQIVKSSEVNLIFLQASTAALCTSGTVAVELQLARLPCLVAYRAHILTEWLIRYKAQVPYISLPNILLDSPFIPEALFNSCTARNLASTLTELIQDEGLREQQMKSAERVVQLLSPPANNYVQYESEDISQPSMIAASTLLHYRRCE